MRLRPLLASGLLALSLLGATCKGGETPGKTGPEAQAKTEPTQKPEEQPVAISEIPGLDLTRVPGSSRPQLIRLLNENFCYCGCPRTLASCLSAKADCSCIKCSERMTQFIVDQLAGGASVEDVELQLIEGFTEGYNGTPQNFDFANQASDGPENAKITLVEFADFKCAHCRAAHPVLRKLLDTHPEARLVYFYFPLGDAASVSALSAEAAEEARIQGKFWEMADLLFENQQALERDDLLKYGESVGLDVPRLKTALEAHTHRETVLADKNIGQKLSIHSTPTIFVNGRRFGLDRTLENFELRLKMEDERGQCQ